MIFMIVRELSALHTKRLMVNFETDETLQEREIDLLTQEITEIFRHAEIILKKFGNQGDEAKISQQELTVRANMQRSLAKKLQGLSMSFRSSQKVWTYNIYLLFIHSFVIYLLYLPIYLFIYLSIHLLGVFGTITSSKEWKWSTSF